MAKVVVGAMVVGAARKEVRAAAARTAVAAVVGLVVAVVLPVERVRGPGAVVAAAHAEAVVAWGKDLAREARAPEMVEATEVAAKARVEMAMVVAAQTARGRLVGVAQAQGEVAGSGPVKEAAVMAAAAMAVAAMAGAVMAAEAMVAAVMEAAATEVAGSEAAGLEAAPVAVRAAVAMVGSTAALANR